jgi:hypothetical protein
LFEIEGAARNSCDKRKEVTVMRQIFIEQRDRGMTWIPRETVIHYGHYDHVNTESLDPSGEQFATRGAAMEAMQQQAWRRIQQKHPHLQKDDVNWRLISEDVREFVMA